MLNSDVSAEFKSRLFFWGATKLEQIHGASSSYRYRLDNPYDLLAEMHRAQWSPRTQIDEKSRGRLRAIVDHAARNISFYKRLYAQAGVSPSAIRELPDIRNLPIVTKDMMRNAGNLVLASVVPRELIRVGYTSGSTGDPFRFYTEPNWGPPRWASSWLMNSYFGARPQTRYFRFLSSDRPEPTEPNIHAVPGVLKLQTALNFQLNNVHWVSGYWLNEERLANLIEGIIRSRPVYGSGNPSFWLLLVDLIEQKGSQFPPLSAVVSDAEMLLPHERKRIEAGLGCPIFDRYGSREFYGAVAGECKFHFGLHVNEELFLVEIVDDNGEPCAEGETGRILITDLHNRFMPFIRYEIGDSAVRGEGCPCGRTFTTMREIVGRTSETIEASGGRKIPVRVVGAYLMIREKFTDWTHYFQMIQVQPGHLILRIVPYGRWTPKVESYIKERLADAEKLFKVDIELQTVSELEKSRSGKRLLFIKAN